MKRRAQIVQLRSEEVERYREIHSAGWPEVLVCQVD